APAEVSKTTPPAKRTRAKTAAPAAIAVATDTAQPDISEASRPPAKRRLPLLPLIGAGALIVGLVIGGIAIGLPASSSEAKLKSTISDLRGENADLKSHNQTLEAAANKVIEEQTKLDADKAAIAREKATADAALAAVNAATFQGDGTYIVGRDVRPASIVPRAVIPATGSSKTHPATSSTTTSGRARP
ncbi:MAG TPA: hypothetical protein VGF80_15620, partial [Galbitalea sp.]